MLNAGAEVILTWDEGNSSDEHVAAIAIGGAAAKGAIDSHSYTQPSLLAGLEDAWHLPRVNRRPNRESPADSLATSTATDDPGSPGWLIGVPSRNGMCSRAMGCWRGVRLRLLR